MSEFTQNITSSAPNQLFDPLMAGRQQAQQNQLAGQQLDLSAADHEQVGRLAAGLLTIADPDQRAQAYTRGVGMLQSQGLAKYAPPTMPDEQSLRMLVSQTIPVEDQYKLGIISPPGLTDALTASRAPLPGQPGYGGAATPGAAGTPSSAIPPRGTGGPGANASAPTAWLPYFEEASKETGIPVDLLIAQARQESGFNADAKGGAGEIGAFQIKPSTAQNPGGGMQGVDPASITGPDNVRNNILFGARYLKARMGGGDPNNPAVQAAGLHAYNGGGDPNYVANVFRYRPTLAASDPNAAVTSYTPGVTAAPTATATAPPGQPVPTQVASNTPMVSTAPASPTAAPAATTATTTTAQPAATSGTGVNSPQFQAASELNRRAAALETQFPNSPAAKAQATALRAQAALYMQADSVSVDPVTGIQTKQLTGERLNAAAPNAHYVWNEQQGAYVDTTGVHPPVTPPSPRLTTTPGGAVLQSKPGGGAAVVYQTPPADITTQEQAKTAGAAAGTVAGKLPGQLANQGREAAQAIGNIDYGMSQIQKAQAGGINTGYFAPWLSTVGAMAKSIGGDTGAKLLGIDPTAVGNVQTAQKTLAVVSGAILQQVLGPDSQITDAKVQHFIHAQPGIETDPDALGRVLNWARSQFVYEREMAAQGMKDAAPTGTLPPGWQAKYFDQHGFAPIYNPGTGEMEQPDGQAAPRQAPGASLTTAPVNPAARTAGTTYNTPKGPMKWTGTGWTAP